MKHSRFRSFQLLPREDLVSGATRDSFSLGKVFRIGLQPETGHFSAQAGQHLTLTLQPDDAQTPEWVEFIWVGGQSISSDLSFVVVRLQGRTDKTCSITPALRLHKDNRYVDVFSKKRIALAAETSAAEVSFDLSPAEMTGCRAIDLHLFFDKISASVTLERLMLTALP